MSISNARHLQSKQTMYNTLNHAGSLGFIILSQAAWFIARPDGTDCTNLLLLLLSVVCCLLSSLLLALLFLSGPWYHLASCSRCNKHTRSNTSQ
jgi:hypothetical protein